MIKLIYLDLHYNYADDGVNYKLGCAGRGVLVYKETLINRYILFGNEGSTATEYIQNRNSPHNRMQSGAAGLDSSVSFSGTGVLAQYRDETINTRLYNKDVEFLRTTTLPTSIYNYGNYTMFRNGPGASRAFTDAGMSMMYFSKNMTQIEHEQYRTDYNKYLVAIGLEPKA